MKSIVFLVSGNGGSLKFINNAIKYYNLDVKISAIIADRNCKALLYGEENNIPTFKIKYKNGYIDELKKQLLSISEVDLIITNIHKIIDSEILSLFKNKFINLHYSLLPAYKGLIGMDTIKQAKLNNAQIIGATCHDVNEIVDEGNIIVQGCFKANWTLPITEIENSMFRIACMCLLTGITMKLNLRHEVKEYRNNGFFFNPNFDFPILHHENEYWDILLK